MDFIVKILYLWLTLFLQCGAPVEHHTSERLVGSDVQSINEFPYIVFIQNLESPIPNPNDTRKDSIDILRHLCAGVIISEYWVLTAATCVKKNPGEVRVFKQDIAGSYYTVNKIIVHPNFKPITTAHPANNIAVLHMNKSLFRNDTNVSAIALGRIPNKSGIRVQTVGWSSTDDRGIFNIDDIFKIRLRKLSLQTMNSGHCRKKHNKLVDNEMCVSGDLGKTWCSIDAGNPVITMNKTRLLGIGIDPTHSCKGDLPGTFVRLSIYIDWLRKVTGLKLPLD